MNVENFEIAKIFLDIADLLEIKGENKFRVRAYRNAARSISEFPQKISDIVSKNIKMPHLVGIGKDLEEKIIEFCNKKTIKLFKELSVELSSGLISLLEIPNLGPKRVKVLWDHLKIKNIGDLKNEAIKHNLQNLPKIGKKIESGILEDIKKLKLTSNRITWVRAEQEVLKITKYLKEKNPHILIITAGSYRRKKETVGDIDLIAVDDHHENIINHFIKYPGTKKILVKGSSKSKILLKTGIKIDLRVVAKESYGAALVYFTGSKNHNIAIRKIAKKNTLKINEYGVYKNENKIAGETELEVYQSIGLPYIEAELRENEGEIEAAIYGKLPKLINIFDIRGDFHVHSKYSDEMLTIEEIVVEAVKKNMNIYRYLIIQKN